MLVRLADDGAQPPRLPFGAGGEQAAPDGQLKGRALEVRGEKGGILAVIGESEQPAPAHRPRPPVGVPDWHRIERLEYIVGWFDKWMRGIPHPEFDLNPADAKAKAGNVQ